MPTKWLIIYENSVEEVMEAETFLDLHGYLDSDEVKAVIKLNSNISAQSY